MAPETVKVTKRVVGEAGDTAAPQEQPQIMMMRDEKDQVLDWLFSSCAAKNRVINDLNQRLVAAQQQSQRLVQQINEKDAEIERLTKIVHPDQPPAPAAGDPAQDGATKPVTAVIPPAVLGTRGNGQTPAAPATDPAAA